MADGSPQPAATSTQPGYLNPMTSLNSYMQPLQGTAQGVYGSGAGNGTSGGYNFSNMPGVNPTMGGVLSTASDNATQNYQNSQNLNMNLENENQSQVNGLLSNYNTSFMNSLGPNGNLGQQLAGEYANYGITPNSGAFQGALGNTMGQLGAQNALTLGQSALQPGINQSYSNEAQLGNTQAGITNQAAQLPINQDQFNQQSSLAQQLAQIQASSSQNAAGKGLEGQLGAGALEGLGTYAGYAAMAA